MFSVLLSLASAKRFHRRHHRPTINSGTSDGYFMIGDINVSYTNCVNVVISKPSDILIKASELKNIDEQLQTDLMIEAEYYFADHSSLGDKYSKSYRSNQQRKRVLKDPSVKFLGFVDAMITDIYYKTVYYVDGWYAELVPEGEKLTLRAISAKVLTEQSNQKGILGEVMDEIFAALNHPRTEEQKQIYNKFFQ